MLLEAIINASYHFELEHRVRPSRITVNEKTRDDIINECIVPIMEAPTYRIFGMEMVVDKSAPDGFVVSDDQPVRIPRLP